MINGQVSSEIRPPILILGLGNSLLCDDGIGLILLENLSREASGWSELAEFVDGGTQGLALLGQLADRSAVIILDAVALGSAPGTIHVLQTGELNQLRTTRATTAHEGNASELLATARMLGYCPEIVTVVGIEPEHIATGVELSRAVAAAIPAAITQAKATAAGIAEGVTYVSCSSR